LLGTFKRAELDVPEDSLLYRALRDFNLPKIIAADLPIFFGLLGDLFPGIDILRKRGMIFIMNKFYIFLKTKFLSRFCIRKNNSTNL